MVKRRITKTALAASVPYDFPLKDILPKLAVVTKESESQDVETLTNVREKKFTIRELYENRELRISYLCLHFRANSSGRVAPYFRNFLVDTPWVWGYLLSDYGSRQERTPEEIQLFRDLVLIDLHWILLRRLKHADRIQGALISASFDDAYFVLVNRKGELDWSAMIEFVRSRYITGTKVRNLSLSYLEQVQCNYLESVRIRDYKFALNDDQTAEKIRKTIKKFVDDPRRSGKTNDLDSILSQWRMLWLAGGSPTDAARLDIMRTGILIDQPSRSFSRLRDSFTARKRWLEKKIRLDIPPFGYETPKNIPDTLRQFASIHSK